MRILLNEETESGNGAPPSAAAVIAGQITEADLRRELEQTKIDLDIALAEKSTTASQKEKLERDIAYLQDQLSALKNAGVTSPPASKTPPVDAPEVEEEHWTKTFIG